MKPKLLVIELWGLGDLAVATPFLRAATERFSVTLLAKPHARELQPRFWSGVELVTFDAPWTAFRGKYRLFEWPWRELTTLYRELRTKQFDYAVSARFDPRDHLLMYALGVKRSVGFARVGSAAFLTDPLSLPAVSAHRYDFWRDVASTLGFHLLTREQLPRAQRSSTQTVLVHSGARLSARVWPLERYAGMVRRLRESGRFVCVVCDVDQEKWWRDHGEHEVVAPKNLAELLALFESAKVFIGNCSGPGHLAAISGVPTFTIFGPSVSGEFLPIHPAAEFIEDNTCQFKPCQDYCHFSVPRCLLNLGEDCVWQRVRAFVDCHAAA